MASTTNLKLVKPVSESDANKVNTLNAEADDLDAAVGGTLVLSVAGSSNVTLSRAQALHKTFKFTGLLTGNITVFFPVIANGAITPPTTTVGSVRDPIIWNATTGAFTLTIKTSAVGSAGIAVTQTKIQHLFHDDTDFKRLHAEL